MIPAMLEHVSSLRECSNFFEDFYNTVLSSDQFIFITYLACYLSMKYPMESTLMICRNLLTRLVIMVAGIEVKVRNNYPAWLFLIYK